MNNPSITRRQALIATVLGTAAVLHDSSRAIADTLATDPSTPITSDGYRRVYMPNGKTLPYKLIHGVKVFHLIAEEFEHEFAPGLKAMCYGFNGSTPGPLIEAVEGDRVRIYVTNKLPMPTSVHWHGLLIPNGMDGVSGLTQAPIQPGETYRYEFELKQHGTLMYHSHYDEMTQIAMGMQGMFVIHPQSPKQQVDFDFAILLSEWSIKAGSHRPDPGEMTDFNVMTINSRCYPGTEPWFVKTGSRVRIRICNLSPMSHHSFHIHGITFNVVATDGGEIPQAGQWPEITVHIPTGSTRTIEFIPTNPGDWAAHCHMTHHAMNQMGHGLANILGMKDEGLDDRIHKIAPGYMTMGNKGMGDMGEMGMAVPDNSLPMLGAPGPHAYIAMGGMFSILKVRDSLDKPDEWFKAPEGTRARAASDDELKNDTIDVSGNQTRVWTPEHHSP